MCVTVFYVMNGHTFLLSGMEKIVVDPVKNVIMLRSTKWDHCVTGHIDRATVDGKVCTSTITLIAAPTTNYYMQSHIDYYYVHVYIILHI